MIQIFSFILISKFNSANPDTESYSDLISVNLKEADVNIACFFKANITIFTFPSFREAVCLSIPDIQEQISVSRINPVSPYINRLFPGDLIVKAQKKSPASKKETGDRKTATTYSPTCAVPSA